MENILLFQIFQDFHKLNKQEKEIFKNFLFSLDLEKRIQMVKKPDLSSIEEAKKVLLKFFDCGFSISENEKISYFHFFKELEFLPLDSNFFVLVEFPFQIFSILGEVRKFITDFELELSSTYATILYDFVLKNKSAKGFEVSIDDIRGVLSLKDKYNNFSDFKGYILDTAIQEINEKTPYSLTCDFKKTHKKFTHLVFKMRKKRGFVEKDTKTIDMFNM